jgi:hypothetical protein
LAISSNVIVAVAFLFAYGEIVTFLCYKSTT